MVRVKYLLGGGGGESTVCLGRDGEKLLWEVLYY